MLDAVLVVRSRHLKHGHFDLEDDLSSYLQLSDNARCVL